MQHLATLKLLTYNCQSLGKGIARLQELTEDLRSLGVHVAGLQGTRWRSQEGRSEFPVRGFSGATHYHCYSWGRPSTNAMLGVQILIHSSLLNHAYIHTRFDPPRGQLGRLGAVRIVGRESGTEMDDLFVCAYAPQETDDVAHRQAFFQALLEILHAVPRRTRIWMLGDFNGHVGADLCSTTVGPLAESVTTNNNGFSTAHVCESANLALINTFCGGGSTCWTPDGRTHHCIDFIAVPTEYKSRVQKCRVKPCAGKTVATVAGERPCPCRSLCALSWTLASSSISKESISLEQACCSTGIGRLWSWQSFHQGLAVCLAASTPRSWNVIGGKLVL